MRPKLLVMLAAFVLCFWLGATCEAGGCRSCPSVGADCESAVVYSMPDQARSVCTNFPATHQATLQRVQGQPVRNVVRAPLRAVGRVVVAPFRFLRGRCFR